MNIHDKIQKLLTLAQNNSNDAEVEQALLKVRELMAKYNISKEQLPDNPAQKVVKIVIPNSNYIEEKGAWKSVVALVISQSCGCVVSKTRFERRKSKYLNLIGFEDVVQICIGMISCAFQYLEYVHDSMIQETHIKQLPWRSRESVFNTFAHGFANGLDMKFKMQNTADQSCALMCVVQPEVKQFIEGMHVSSPQTLRVSGNSEHYDAGYYCGLKFQFATQQLESGDD